MPKGKRIWLREDAYRTAFNLSSLMGCSVEELVEALITAFHSMPSAFKRYVEEVMVKGGYHLDYRAALLWLVNYGLSLWGFIRELAEHTKIDELGMTLKDMSWFEGLEGIRLCFVATSKGSPWVTSA